VPCISLAAVDDLEIVPVQMERVLPGVVVVDHDLDDRHVGENVGVCVDSVHCWIGGEFTCAEDGVQCGDFGVHIGDVVEEGVVGAVAEVGHVDFQGYDDVWFWEQLCVIGGNQVNVV